MKIKNFLATTTALALALTAGCGRSEPPVARLKVEPATLSLPYPQLATVNLTWEPITALPNPPTVFVHLVDQQGEIERTFDHPYPAAFQPGKAQTYPVHLYQTALATPLPAGKHRLVAGLYQPGGDRFAVEAGGEEFKKREYVIATIDVPALDPKAPKLAFTRTWLPAEDGGDRQTITRRWLTGEGAIRFSSLGKPGTFFLSLRIPAGDNPGEKLVTTAANPPSVEVTSACGGLSTNVSGPGNHLVALEVDPAPADGQCVVRLVPNFQLQVQGSPHLRTVALENAAWSPKAGS